MKQTTTEHLERAILVIGGVAETVRKLNLNGHATVFQWKKTRVPAERCPAIEQATGGLVRCEDLRPDVQWSVLRNTPEQAQSPANQPQPAINAVTQGV